MTKVCLCPYGLKQSTLQSGMDLANNRTVHCSYAGTVKALEAKHLAHPLQTFSHHQHYAQDRKFQRTSKVNTRD